MFLQLTTFRICHLKRIDGLDTGEKKQQNMQAATRNQQKENFPMKYPSDTDVAGCLMKHRIWKDSRPSG